MPNSSISVRLVRRFGGKLLSYFCILDFALAHILSWILPDIYGGKRAMSSFSIDWSSKPVNAAVFACFVNNSSEMAELAPLISELEARFSIVLIINTGSLDINNSETSMCIRRSNHGRDLFSYALGAVVLKDLELEEVVFLNDSVHWNEDSINKFLDQAAQLSARVVGLTESNQGSYHLQSFALAIKKPSKEIFQIIGGIKPFICKRTLVEYGEKKISRRFLDSGIQIAAIHDYPKLARNIFIYRELYSTDYAELTALINQRVDLNPSIHFWPQLFVDSGFVKKSLITKNPAKLINSPVSLSDCKEKLISY